MKPTVICNRLLNSFLVFLFLFLVPLQALASFSISVQPVVDGTTVRFSVKSTEPAPYTAIRISSSSTSYDEQKVAFTENALEKKIAFTNLLPETSYEITLLEYLSADANAIPKNTIPLGKFSTKKEAPRPIQGTQSFTMSRPTVSLTNKTATFTIKSTLPQSDVFVFIEASENANARQSKSIVFTENALSQTVNFDNLLSNMTYSVTLKKKEGSTYTTVRQFGTFSTKEGQAQATFTPAAQDPAAVSIELPGGKSECNDKIDNDGDGRADYAGLDSNNDGVIDIEPDPACFSKDSKIEYADDVKSTIIPCTNKCTFSDFIRLLNNLFVYIIRVVMLPLFVVIIMYLGVRYIKAQGNSVELTSIKKTFGNLFLGIILILGAWLIVTTFLKAIGYQDHILFFETQKK